MSDDKKDIKSDLNNLKHALVNFVVPIICLGITVVLFVSIIYPAYTELPTLKDDLQRKETLSVQLESKIRNLKKLVDFKSAVDEDEKLISDTLVSEPQVPQLLTQIDIIARENGLTLNKLSYSITESDEKNKEAAKTQKVLNVTVVLSALGSHDQLINFFKSLENAARIVQIKTFRYEQSQDPDTLGALGFSIVITSPYLYVQSNAVTDDPVDLDINDKEFLNTVSEVKKYKFYRPTLEEINKFLSKPVAEESTPSEETPPVQ
ncbi:hypothetical protein A3F07_03250 [candidate division WWE3 bacterium RIFCSPHIGHO2_12_FULL_38_15]|uniref:Pilus assembly protein PilO n=1 Tax=candidate division WWE3 bacterium RIFCSPHIGHO2_02_FULL_38_14 TaxID=1802620 RepID=A0A1F4V6G7_UNCKA|nr:MAG: hypothetical protein A2793_03565 [candidate division WWE3 bacterium RIFCSPHIGHO2_01_FULL_38_45]OGC48818.1 MAG: hypothetical protein A3F07_03250 [candidate division WWE3 bacterium RIFCSPHIGHO2_12_FULL_38_15]OGC52774.1 MAG: hypothetical protein A3D91_01940 [candidate division WWE3 bacterium RIFCSPHIGHO2_02_FULL_38_14]OGC53121.1 MAG: hypothetical protein A3B64_01590 [candidate division WWE3 bacterium RIFCSPLOWO2_01_FULL_37_24]HLB51960.1 type 4a pilus biogenesis protein PilO [Patescibacteri